MKHSIIRAVHLPPTTGLLCILFMKHSLIHAVHLPPTTGLLIIVAMH
uniref:Uncharacterized protein n=1 Tax=Arundo donax TaxID=35708 RepID=A0A0A8ZJW7_ARUDO